MNLCRQAELLKSLRWVCHHSRCIHSTARSSVSTENDLKFTQEGIFSNIEFQGIMTNITIWGARWLSGKFGAFRPEGRRFESYSSCHVGTLGKSCITWCGTMCGCLAVKFDSCNSLLSSVHTMSVIHTVRVWNIKARKIIIISWIYQKFKISVIFKHSSHQKLSAHVLQI